jgi:CRP-like cAMP-binding protein
MQNEAPSALPDCGQCPVGEVAICRPLEGIDPKLVRRIRSEQRRLVAGSHLYREGDANAEFFMVVDGLVSLYRSFDRSFDQGGRVILDFGLPGSFIGYQPDHHDLMLHSAECLSDVILCAFPSRSFHLLAHNNPALAERLAAWNWRETTIAQNHLTNMASRPAKARIAHLLFELCTRLPCPGFGEGDGGCQIPVTQSHIADALSLNIAHVCRKLKELKREGVLEFRWGRLRVGQGATAVCRVKDLPPSLEL